jgi:predicted dehydrogenase/nucleoside-diphosphate-sugar epimerase
MNDYPKQRLGIIGCGAVTEQGHLPAAARCDKVKVTKLVDKNIVRAQNLAQQFNIPEVADDYTRSFDKVDAVIVALPHYLHAPVSIEFLKRGIHVLVEKPMALNVAECDAMIDAAHQGKATLAVGLWRRFLPSYQFVKTMIDAGFLGAVVSFDIREGFVYNWPVTSDFFFRKETAGGGVLIDTGAYTMDSVQYWFGDCGSLEYFDDNMGGVEADCEIHLQMRNGAKGFVELSRTRNLRNTAIIRGEEGSLEVSLHTPKLTIRPKGLHVKVEGDLLEEPPGGLKKGSLVDYLKAQLDDWLEAITDKRPPRVPGEEARKSIALIEACYNNRKPLEQPWLTAKLPDHIARLNLRGTKVLVTGGTGFMGGRLVEHLMNYSADVRILVRNFAHASRIARFPIKMVLGDVTDLAAVRKAMEGCEIVFHCAYGKTGSPAQQREVTVKGTENVLKAALEHHVKRVTHVSTISVYGQTKDGDLDESAPRKYSKDIYADSKLEAEELAFHYFEKYGLPVSIIQPTVVFGPFSDPWTLGPITQLKTGRVVVVDGGGGLCNAVYVDDIIQGMILAATKDEAIGQAFLISAEEPVTWRDFYGAYERMLGVNSTISMSLKEIEDFNRRYKKEHGTVNQVMVTLRNNPYILSRILKLPAINKTYRMVETVLPDPLWNRLKNAFISRLKIDHESQASLEKPILPLTTTRARFFQAHTLVKIDKAKRLLGYEPTFNFEQGMKLTEMWVRYSNLTGRR